MTKNNIGVYCHIPFCIRICSYCDFCKTTFEKEKAIKYINELIYEIDQFDFANYNIDTIYIGGGTPNLISDELLTSLMKKFDLTNCREATIECIPEFVNEKTIELYKNLGFNRISLGVETSDEKVISNINRVQTRESIIKSYKIIEKYFKNINLDFIYGLQYQTIQSVTEDLELIGILKPQHISYYQLQIEPNTKVYFDIYKHHTFEPDDYLVYDMDILINKKLIELGYSHYEISNYSLGEQYESIHNTKYWTMEEYVGFGASACGFIDGKRISNSKSINITGQERIKTATTAKQTKLDQFKDTIIFGLRLLRGVNTLTLKKKYPTYLKTYLPTIDELIKDGLLEYSLDRLRLTEQGLKFGNLVWEKFI